MADAVADMIKAGRTRHEHKERLTAMRNGNDGRAADAA
jgi:hypothetical protein